MPDVGQIADQYVKRSYAKADRFRGPQRFDDNFNHPAAKIQEGRAEQGSIGAQQMREEGHPVLRQEHRACLDQCCARKGAYVHGGVL